MANGLPQLNTGGINIVPGLQQGMQMRNMQQQNALNSMRLQQMPEDRNYLLKTREREEATAKRQIALDDVALKIKAIDASMKIGGSVENMGKTFESIYGKPATFKISPDEKDVAIVMPDGSKLVGPKAIVAEGAHNMTLNPKYIEDPNSWKYLFSKGMKTIDAPKKQAHTVGDIRDFQKGSETVTQEWTGTEWKKIGSGPKFKPDTDAKLTPDKARERRQQTVLAIKNLESGGGIDEQIFKMMGMINPQRAAELRASQDVTEAKAILQKDIDYYDSIIGDTADPQKIKPSLSWRNYR